MMIYFKLALCSYCIYEDTDLEQMGKKSKFIIIILFLILSLKAIGIYVCDPRSP